MKRLRISKLMDEYTDTEFFPAGGSAADPEKVKERVLAQAKASDPMKKKQLQRKKKVMLAAALAAVLVVLMGAGFPYIQHRLISGTLSFEQVGNNKSTFYVYDGDLVKYEDGCLIFDRHDESIDITELVSEDTPYIYDGSDPDTGMIYYVIMGGTPEAYGWLEWIQVPYPFDDCNSDAPYAVDFDENGNPVKIIRKFELKSPEYSWGRFGASGRVVYLDEIMKLPWLLAGMDQLGIAFQDAPECE